MSHPPLWRWRSPRPASANTGAATTVWWVGSPSASLAAPGDGRLAQFRLSREVIVQRQLRASDLLRHICVAEAVEAGTLNDPLGDVEDHRARVNCCHGRLLNSRASGSFGDVRIDI